MTPDQKELHTLLVDPRATVSLVVLYAVRKFGLECLQFEPLVVRDMILDAVGEKRMPQHMFDKLGCGLTLLATDAYTARIEAFISCNSIMSFRPFKERILGKNDAFSMTRGVFEFLSLTGDSVDELRVAPEIRVYAGDTLFDLGLSDAPGFLSFAEFPADKVARSIPNFGADPAVFVSLQTSRKNDLIRCAKEHKEEIQRQLAVLDRAVPTPASDVGITDK